MLTKSEKATLFLLPAIGIMVALAAWLYSFRSVGPSPFDPKPDPQPAEVPATSTAARQTVESSESESETYDDSNPNVVTSDTGDGWIPAAGYSWVNDNDPNDLRVVWNPGSKHPEYPHVVASNSPTDWHPDDGYQWVQSSEEFRVVWVPGSYHSEYPNVVAAEKEGDFTPALGYEWLKPNDLTDLRTRKSTK